MIEFAEFYTSSILTWAGITFGTTSFILATGWGVAQIVAAVRGAPRLVHNTFVEAGEPFFFDPGADHEDLPDIEKRH